jgi:hypothetical protein
MNTDSPAYHSERTEAITWLRDALTATLEICPLSYRQKKDTARFLAKIPNWLMAKWAESLNIDYSAGCTRHPEMNEKIKSDIGKQMAQQYLEAHDAVPVGNCLDQLVKTVVKQANENGLPVDRDTIARQVLALALAGCNTEGFGFSEVAGNILGDADSPNHPIVNYHLALANGNKSKIEALDASLTGGRYGNWVNERFNEVKRWLCGDTELNIHWDIETLPNNEDIYKFLLKGGKKK